MMKTNSSKNGPKFGRTHQTPFLMPIICNFRCLTCLIATNLLNTLFFTFIERKFIFHRDSRDFPVNIKVKDCTSPGTVKFHSFILPVTIEVKDLQQRVNERANISNHDTTHLSFIGIGQDGSNEIPITGAKGDLRDVLAGIDIKPDSNLCFMLAISDEINAMNKSKVEFDLSSMDLSPRNGCESPATPLPAIAENIDLPEDSQQSSSPVGSSNPSKTNGGGEHTIEEEEDKSPPKHFVGLVNQAMTCYLNSLIQTLFMTPEFRNAIYSWNPDPYIVDDLSRCRSIPYQLQRLFLKLQFCQRQAVETTSLTKSFGWESSEAWEQHDVQELCRLLFDALEVTWAGTDKSDLIDFLYQGKMEDYVECLKCGHSSPKPAKYQDISLPIRSFDGSESYGTIHKALEAFIKPETLTDDNKYFCEKCQEKQDANKGLRFQSFPRIVTMQLKRFDFDYQYGNRVKLSDRVHFPNFINLDKYLPHGKPRKSEEAPHQDEVENQQNPTVEEEKDDEDSPDVKSRYELFSVLIHSGSASGGHYYAFIKNFEDGHFYCFNDRVVRRCQPDEITNSFGSSNGTASAYSYSTCAYMLMYRLCSEETAHFLQLNDMKDSPWLLKQIGEIERENTASSSGRQLLAKANGHEDSTNTASPSSSNGAVTNEGTITATVFYMHPDTCVATPSRVRLAPQTNLKDAADIVVSELNLDKMFDKSEIHYRLLLYHGYSKVCTVVMDDDSEPTIGDAIAKCSKSNVNFYLEILPADLPFATYTWDGKFILL